MKIKSNILIELQKWICRKGDSVIKNILFEKKGDKWNFVACSGQVLLAVETGLFAENIPDMSKNYDFTKIKLAKNEDLILTFKEGFLQIEGSKSGVWIAREESGQFPNWRKVAFPSPEFNKEWPERRFTCFSSENLKKLEELLAMCYGKKFRAPKHWTDENSPVLWEIEKESYKYTAVLMPCRIY